MLSGKDLGRAIEQAIEKKLIKGTAKSKAEIARHFKIKPPSLYDWTGKGSISKEKLPELWKYFSDVVGPEHWGLKSSLISDTSVPVDTDVLSSNRVLELYKIAPKERKAVIDYLLSPESENEPAWADADARAYVIALDSKARQWLKDEENRLEREFSGKTGT
ncbi:hypothetical protein EH228_08795 [Erwinia endophytica]|uniref:DNA-binding transcriptional repressor RacR n=1 Tax=Erwinia endophytica TaxID=1563158 RepID=UPI001265EFAF|nr:hypothetical protein [Erwinia endophytica]KAB8312268.1 hypothetical protein EH228_08795 [Erwinia endophytica]